jgi:hypothetical protein
LRMSVTTEIASNLVMFTMIWVKLLNLVNFNSKLQWILGVGLNQECTQLQIQLDLIGHLQNN